MEAILAGAGLACALLAVLTWTWGRKRPEEAAILARIWKGEAVAAGVCALLLVGVLLGRSGGAPASSERAAPPAQAPTPAPQPPPEPRRDPAEVALEKARAEAEELTRLGAEAERGRNYIEARRSYQRATTLDPAHSEAWFHLARMEALRGEAALALEALRSHRALLPDGDLRARVEGSVDFEPCFEHPSFDEGLKAILAGADLAPALASLRQQPPPGQAPPEPTFDDDLGPAVPAAPARLPEANPALGSPMALARELNRRGYQAYKEGQYDTARNLYYQATQVHPQTAMPWYNLACMEAMRGDVDGAVVALRRFRALKPDVALIQKVNNDRDFDAIRRSAYFQEELRTMAGGR